MTPRPLPKTIGRYEIVDRLGHGGMGVVYLAQDPRIGRRVAVKVLRVGDDDLRDRFQKEAQSAGGLAHPNIVTLYDYGEHEDQPFLVMEFVDGPTLADLLRGKRALPVGQALDIIDATCAGLHYAHERGIVHRDVKPANIMIGAGGAVKVVDFGIARLGDSTLTQTGAMMGTPNYMSPEQVEGRPIDRRSDVFAVGLLLYETLTGQRAFDGETPHSVLLKIVSGTPAPLRSIDPDLDPALADIVDRTIQRAPADRYQTLAEMRDAVRQVRAKLGPDTSSPGAFSAAATPAPVTPDPRRTPRGTTDVDRLERLRAEQIRTHLDRAREAYGWGDFVAAMAACEQALLLEPHHEASLELLERVRIALDESGGAAPAETSPHPPIYDPATRKREDLTWVLPEPMRAPPAPPGPEHDAGRDDQVAPADGTYAERPADGPPSSSGRWEGVGGPAAAAGSDAVRPEFGRHLESQLEPDRSAPAEGAEDDGPSSQPLPSDADSGSGAEAWPNHAGEISGGPVDSDAPSPEVGAKAPMSRGPLVKAAIAAVALIAAVLGWRAWPKEAEAPPPTTAPPITRQDATPASPSNPSPEGAPAQGPTPASVPVSQTVFVNAVPWASVRIAGADARLVSEKTTPFSVQLAPGQYTFEFRNPAFRDAVRDVTIGTTSPAPVIVTLPGVDVDRIVDDVLGAPATRTDQ